MWCLDAACEMASSPFELLPATATFTPLVQAAPTLFLRQKRQRAEQGWYPIARSHTPCAISRICRLFD
jgi:hypothetical protein